MHLSDKVSSNGTDDSTNSLKNQRERRSKRGGKEKKNTALCVLVGVWREWIWLDGIFIWTRSYTVICMGEDVLFFCHVHASQIWIIKGSWCLVDRLIFPLNAMYKLKKACGSLIEKIVISKDFKLLGKWNVSKGTYIFFFYLTSKILCTW